MTFKEATLRLKEASLAFCKPGTERVEALCALLGHARKHTFIPCLVQSLEFCFGGASGLLCDIFHSAFLCRMQN